MLGDGGNSRETAGRGIPAGWERGRRANRSVLSLSKTKKEEDGRVHMAICAAVLSDALGPQVFR